MLLDVFTIIVNAILVKMIVHILLLDQEHFHFVMESKIQMETSVLQIMTMMVLADKEIVVTMLQIVSRLMRNVRIIILHVNRTVKDV